MTRHPDEKPLQFLGQTISETEFRREYPAYASYVPLVRAGADTPQKVEMELFHQNKKRSGKALRGRVSKRRRAA